MTGPDKPEPPQVLAFTFEHLDRALDEFGAEAGAVLIELGGRDHFFASDVVRASEVLHAAIRRLSPQQTLILSIGGYDQDPRELHEVSEVRRFLRRVLKHAGITHWSNPAVAMLNEESLALLLDCGVFGKDHPWTVEHSRRRAGNDRQ